LALKRIFRAALIMMTAASPLAADSAFHVQRVRSSDGVPVYAGSFDEKKNQPIRVADLKFPNGAVLAMTPEQADALDIEPLGEYAALSPDRRKSLDAFFRKTLVPFLRLLRKPNGAVSSGAAVERAADRVFPSPDVGAALKELAGASADPDNNEAKIRGCAARLNAVFHPLGVHLTFGRFTEFDGGTVELSVYWVSQRLLVQINDRTLPVYMLAPFDQRFCVPALGMMEPYPPRIFILADMVARQVRDINVFLRGDKDYPFEDPGVPVASVPDAVQIKINQIVRSNLRRAVGNDRYAVEQWLVRSVARHEGLHLYIDRAMKAAAESHKIEWEDFNVYHERQAYLFELETSDPEFTPFVLLASFAISAALSDKYSRVGCGAALRGLQKQLPSVKFWDGDFNRPIANGLIPLFEAPPSGVRAAAGRARREVEAFLTSSDGLSEETKKGR
jgi:hypothetical protein